MPVNKNVKFTDKYLQSLKPEDVRFFRREARGFTIRVMPTGLKTFLYIYTLKGNRRQMNLGVYPGVSLADARERYNAAYKIVQRKEDPQAVDKETELKSFKEFAAEYLKAYIRKNAERSAYTTERSLKNDILPYWGELDILSIRKRDAIVLLERVAARSPGQVQNVYKAARGVFEYAIDREYLEVNPVQRLSRAVPELKKNARERSLSNLEIKSVWNSLDNYNASKALKLILVTAQRPGEVAGMHRRELEGNIWTIPKERSKTKIEHSVYLTDLALSLIGEAKGYIFEGRTTDKPLARSSLASAVSKDQGARAAYHGLPRWTPHDLRRTARTNMARIGIPEEHAEAILGHQKQGVVKVYNQYSYQEEKKQALIKWEAELLKLVS